MSGYIHDLDPSVDRVPVHFKNRYGMEISGDMYTMKDIDRSKPNPALVVGAPYGGVKEQGPCVYGS